MRPLGRSGGQLGDRSANYLLPPAAWRRARLKSTRSSDQGRRVRRSRLSPNDRRLRGRAAPGTEDRDRARVDRPPTELEQIAYAVEQNDHRGTFYFAQLATSAAPDSKGLVGFHGAGGGGSMMSMDAIVNAGFTIANFTDTSGNPSASKVYRASRIILAQPDLVGYFGSGSGVASQEQYWSAYGLAKAFWEFDLDIPAVIRLGGNTEDRAVDILRRMSKLLRAPVEGYRKTDAPAMIAERFAKLVAGAGGTKWKPRAPRIPKFVKNSSAAMLPVKGGKVWIDSEKWPAIRPR